MTHRHAADVLLTLVERDVKVRYRHSLLGVLWSQLGPLALLVVMSFVFMRVIPLHVPHYPLFVVVGLLAWTWFATAVEAATHSVVSGRELVRRPGFAPVLLPATAVVTQLVHFLLALPVLLLAVWLVLGHLPVTVVALPAVVVAQLAVTLPPALVLCALNVRWRDVGQAVTVALMPLFYATPVFYPPSRVPARWHPLLALNPLGWLVTAYRDVLLSARWPSWGALAVLTVLGAGAAMLSRRFVERHAHEFAEEL